MSNFLVPTGTVRAYTLHKDRDGFLYVFNGGSPESRYGFRPANKTEEEAAADLVAVLNQPAYAIKTCGPRRALRAYQLMLRIW